VILVQPEQLSNVWPKVHAWIQSALEYGQGDENATDVLISIAVGRYLLFHEPDKFAIVAQVQSFPRQKVITVLYLGGGDMDAIKQGIEEAKPWCKAQGITAFRVWGRKGWKRVLEMTEKGYILQSEIL
jgi:hypothetical protein